MQQMSQVMRERRDAYHRARRAERQARVGIIPNPARIDLPVVVPREVWSRWPKLRSTRRLRKTRPDQAEPTDALLSDDMLRAFAEEMRNGELTNRIAVEVSAPPEQDFLPPLTRARFLIRLALGVFLAALGLIGLALLRG